MAMSDDLKAIEAQVQRGLTSVESPEALEALRVNVLGRKGSLTAIMRVGVGKKSMAFSLEYRAADHTLTSEEVEKTHAKLVEKVLRATGGEIRG